MSTVPSVELGVLGPLQVRQDGTPVVIPGAKPRAILTMLGLHNGSVVSADTLLALLWGEDPPRTAAKALQTHISSLRRALGEGVVVTQGTGWTLHGPDVDATRYKTAAKAGRDAAAAGDTSQAVARFEEALALWRGIPELPDGRRGTSEKTRWIEGYSALVEDRADALLATGRAAELIGELEGAVADAPLRERRWGQLMLALYRAGRQGEALGAFQRARALLAEELGVDPGPDLRRLESAIVAQDSALETPAVQHVPAVTRAVTFLLTDIEGSTAAWEADADAMAIALARHDELVEQVVTSRGGRLIKTRGEGDATFSVFERPSAAAAAAIELQEAIGGEPWALGEPMRVRVALHTGEVEFRDGDYFGRAVNRAARLRSLAAGGQILCSGATAELVIDTLPDDVVLADLGTRELRNLARPERVFELRLDAAEATSSPAPAEAPLQRPALPAVLASPGPFVGRVRELAQLFSAWQTVLAGDTNAMLIAGEPGVGKTRLAGEWSRQAYDQGALVIYGRCDEDLGAPYQPFAEALRSLVPCLGPGKLRGLRGVEALLTLVPGLADAVPDLPSPTRADPDTERYALFDAVVAVLGVASASAPVVLILDDLHWAAKPTLLLLRHLLRFGEQARVQIVGTYRSTDLDRSHPLAAMLADLHRDGTASRIQLSGLDETDVTTYLAEAGYHDDELARALASVTGGNPFFLIEALRHVDESGGQWDPSTLPQGVREAVSRRLSRLPAETNKALAAAAVVGARFGLELVESVVGDDLVDAFDEACKAGIVIEEPGGRYRFNHALVRQSLLAELPSVRRMRLHQRIATTLEGQPGAQDEQGELLAELAYHYFECAWAGNAAKAVEYCRRAADQAMARLAYEGAADLYDRALHAMEEIDDDLPDRDEQVAVMLVARCEALLAAGDVASATGAVSQLQEATRGSVRLAAWAACFDGQLSMLIHPDRLDEAEAAVGAAAVTLAELEDTAGEAKAHTVRAGCLARLGRIGDCEIALDDALTAARRAREHRRVNAVLANAPLAALWGPNPVPRAGGRCLDVVRLLRITTDSPAVEATSTRCQAVLEAFRGRAAAARRMIESARRTVTELGLRHALLEVEQFAGIVELVVDDPGAAEPHLRQAYNGFRRMGLDADTAETAALLGRTCLALDRADEADELCTESERLAGHALKGSIAWRILRAQLLSRGNAHDEARVVAEAAVSRAERTDALVDHGDACLALATVLHAAGDTRGARAAAERAISLYELKGAAALVDKARGVAGAADLRQPPQTQLGSVELTNSCTQSGNRVVGAVNREAWQELEEVLAPLVSVESRRKIVGFARMDVPSSRWPEDMRRYLETGMVRYHQTALAVRGDRLALFRLELGTTDRSSGAPRDEELQVVALDENGRVALQVKFDVEDIEAATAELDAQYAAAAAPVEPDNAAARAMRRVVDAAERGAWDELEKLHTPHRFESRRKIVGFTHDDLSAGDVRAMFENSASRLRHEIIAARGERLALARLEVGTDDESPGAPHDVILHLIGLDESGHIALEMLFDLDDIDAALAELDALHAAPAAVELDNACARVIRGMTAAIARGDWDELEELHGPHPVESRRRVVGFTRDNLSASELRRLFQSSGMRIRNEIIAVRGERFALTRLEIGTDDDSAGAPHDEMLHLIGIDENGRAVFEVFFDIDDIGAATAELDAAYVRFEKPRHRAPLENAASRADGRFNAFFGNRRWDEIGALLTDDIRVEDRRRGLRREGNDRAAELAELRAIADVGTKIMTSDVLANRGERLALVRTLYSGRDQRPEAFHTEVLRIAEINADGRIAAYVAFDPDDFDAAIAELDARYLAGEGAPHSQTWSAIARGYADLNRQKLFATTPDFEDIDHRRAAPFAPGDLIEYMRAAWDLGVSPKICIDTIHQLSDFGAVVTHSARGTSPEGADFEWRDVNLLMTDGESFSRCELFDEADLDAALAKFDQLSRQAPQLENAASKVAERFLAFFAARDWSGTADRLADDCYSDDRRRVVNGGLQGRDAVIESFRSAADLELAQATSDPIATRGECLVLAHFHFSRGDETPNSFHLDVLQIVEIDADQRIAALVTFDPDDFDAAIAELDARYLAGEASAHSHTWSLVVAAFAAINRHELPELVPNWVNIDHRRGAAFATGDMTAYLNDLLNDTPDINVYGAVVHRLSDLGAVIAQVGHGISQQGFQAEWRDIGIFTFDGDLLSHYELFDQTDLDAAVAKFEQLSRPARQLENAAIRTWDRLRSFFDARDWDALAEVYAEDHFHDDRRRVTGAGIRRGRNASVENMRVVADLVEKMAGEVIAIRGEHLVLARVRYWGPDKQPQAFLVDMLCIGETNLDDRMSAFVAFDPDDFQAAMAELDARYLAGEAATHANTWSAIARTYASLNRRALPATAPDWVNIDNRRAAAFAPGDALAYVRAIWDLTTDLDIYVENVFRLSDVGVVVTHASRGTSPEGFDAEWRAVNIFTVEGDKISRTETYDEADLDTALAKFELLGRPATRLTNAASQVAERFMSHYAKGDWGALAEILTNDFSSDDRRRVVGAGIRQGPDAQIADMQAMTDLSITKITATPVAIRGERLVLVHSHLTDRDQGPEAFLTEVLAIVEIDAAERVVALVSFDAADIEAAITELDARFLAGEAAAHANTWSVIAAARAALMQHELPPTTPDWVNVDHRRGIAFAPGDMTAYIRATWDLEQIVSSYIEAVQRLSERGAVFVQMLKTTSQDGFDAEWRYAELITVEGGLVSRCEVFEEAQLDAALAKFEELSRSRPRLDNAASQVAERFLSSFAARNWDVMAELMADDSFSDDRRSVIGAGVRRGPGAVVAEMRANAELWIEQGTINILATRGARLALMDARFTGSDQDPEAFFVEILAVGEINADERIVAMVAFDPDDFEAAIAELDARYLAGEAAAHARTWSAIARAYTSISGRELPATTPDWVNVDHRRAAAFAPGDAIEYIRAAWDLTTGLNLYVEDVRLLTDLGAVVTHASHGTSREGFDAEWRWVNLFTVEGDNISRTEMFDEADLDAAIVKFEELSDDAPKPENTASQVAQRFMVRFAGNDWDGMKEMLADNFSSDDRRRVVGAGVRDGQDAWMTDMRATADLWATDATLTTIATRGRRLVLLRTRFSDREPGDKTYLTELFGIVEINAEERISAILSFDLDDFEAAIAELDARYLAGEAAAHAQTWAAIMRGFAAIERGVMPATTTRFVDIDHRRLTTIGQGDLEAYLQAAFDDIARNTCYVEAVHTLSELGAVVTHVWKATSDQGFDAEWRITDVLTVDGDLIDVCEMFDEADLDTALAKFDQLSRPAPRLENAATKAAQRFWTYFTARDWDALAEILADDYYSDDRRPVVGAGARRGRDRALSNLRTVADLGFTNAETTVIAIRGDRLGLVRSVYSDGGQGAAAVVTDVLGLVEVNADGLAAAILVFEPDDIEDALEELDARYLAGEAAAHAATWSVIARARAALLRHELPPTTPDWVNLDHRRVIAFSEGDFTQYLRAGWDQEHRMSTYIDAVHRLNHRGAVFTQVATGTSHEGFDAEWRLVELMTVDDGLISRAEFFDETDLDAALAKFDEFNAPTRQLKNTASLVGQRYREYFAAGDWDAMAAIIADDFFGDDRRRVVGSGVRIGREAQLADMRAIADLFIANMTWTDIATRGDHLVLFRVGFLDRTQRPDAFQTEVLCILEIDADERIVTSVSFDLDDTEAAFEELETRYLAGEAADHADTWAVFTRSFAAVNRGEMPSTTTDYIFVDHRLQHESRGLTEYLHASWDLMPDFRTYIEAVHRLTDLGTVITLVVHGISQDGFDAEWRLIELLTRDGGAGNRCEIFDETDLDAALARFEELHSQSRRPENAAARVSGRYFANFRARDWAAIAGMLADDSFVEDRNRVVNVGVWEGRDAVIANLRALEEAGANITSTAIATRGERLALTLMRSPSGDPRYGEFDSELIILVEIDSKERIAAQFVFNCDDIDAALAELDKRYLSGEAAAHAHTWSVIAEAYAAMNRHELPATMPDWANVDHRRGIAFAPGDATTYLRAAHDPDGSVYVETVQRLGRLGAVFTWAGHGISKEGFEAEWRGINVVTVDGELIARGEIFDEEDLEAALAKFEELQPRTPRLENAASRITERLQTCFGARDWTAMVEMLSDDVLSEDRRRVVNAGIRRGRDAAIRDARANAELDLGNVTSSVIATRGARLVLRSARYSGEAFHTDVLSVFEIDAEDRVVARVVFDLEDIDAAFKELDARYLAGEAAAHARTWTVIAAAYASLNRGEIPSTTKDFVDIDHRPLAIGSGDLKAYLATALSDPNNRLYVEAVHQLTDHGAVVTHVATVTSQEGFDAEWRMTDIFVVEGDLLSRGEIFDETDLEAALARFEELHPQKRRLENAASRVAARFFAHFGAREWDAMAEVLAADSLVDDRRRVVNAGFWDGRDAVTANLRALAEGDTVVKLTVIATRGDRLALTRISYPNRDPLRGAFDVEMLGIAEIDVDNRIAAHIAFDLEDFDAAFVELDRRYLAGESAAHAHTFSVIAEGFASLNRHEIPATTPDFVDVDHRPLAIASGDLKAYLSATFGETAHTSVYIEAVHQLTDVGAVITLTGNRTSADDFDAEWCMIDIFTVAGEAVDRCEIFDEADLDAALARFEELHARTPRLENAASRIIERYQADFAVRDWAAIADNSADEIFTDDRRSVVSSGTLHGREAKIANIQAIAELGSANLTSTVIAIRGELLALAQFRMAGRDQRPDAFRTDMLGLVELDADNRVTARILFDLDDINAAYAELDARYLNGEAAPHRRTWSAIASMYSAFNRRELPAPDWVTVDHRPGTPFADSDISESISSSLDLTPNLSIHIETVHRLSNMGAVLTNISYGTSPEGFEAEWRMIQLLTVEDDHINRLELFDEADLDAALARFDELSGTAQLD